MTKEYGKLSLAQLKEALALEAQFGDLEDHINGVVASKPELRAKIAGNGIAWSPAYDRPFADQLESFLRAFGLMHHVREAGQASDQQQAMLNLANNESIDPFGNDEASRDTFIKIFGLLIGLTRTFDSLLVFGKYINELVAEGRAGNDSAFFDAIRIDPTVITTSAFQDRLSKAVAVNDQRFLEKLQQALKGKTEKHKSQLNRVRFAIRALLDAGGLKLPDREIQDLFVRKLGIYSPGSNAPKAIRKHIQKQKKQVATQKRRI